MTLLWLVPLYLAYLVLLRVGSTLLDHRRIRRHVRKHGGKAITITWAPFRPSWSFESSNHVYAVTIEGQDGSIRTVHCTTSLGDGVSLIDDRDEPLEMDLHTIGSELALKRRRLQREPGLPEPGQPPPPDGD